MKTKHFSPEELLPFNEDAEAELRERARTDLLAFTLYTKPDYEVGWVHKKLCLTLDRFARGEIPRLMITAPPRHGKSELVSRRLPAFTLGVNPDAAIIACSYSADLSSRMNRDVQRIIDTPQYADVFPETQLFGKNIRSVAKGSWLRNADIFEVVNHRGVYRSAGVGGGITGMGADFAIIDDPIKDQKEADSLTVRNNIWEWYGSTLYSRLEKNGCILLTMTRWHEDDLAGRLIQQQKDNPEADRWEILNLPALATEDEPKRKKDEALWPWKYPAARLRGMKATMGTRKFLALYQGSPTSPEGALVKRSWIKFYRQLPDKFDELVQSWDFTTKDGDANDYTVGQVWGRKGASYYLVDQVRDHMELPAEIRAVKSISAKHKMAFVKIVEDASNGPAVVSALKAAIAGLILWRPDRSKAGRLAAVSPAFEAGNVYYPDPSIAPWVHDNIEELVNFPNVKNDDTVDASTQALLRFQGVIGGEIADATIEKRPATIVPGMDEGERW